MTRPIADMQRDLDAANEALTETARAAGVLLDELPVEVRRTVAWLSQWPNRLADVQALVARAHSAGFTDGFGVTAGIRRKKAEREAFEAAEAEHLDHFLKVVS